MLDLTKPMEFIVKMLTDPPRPAKLIRVDGSEFNPLVFEVQRGDYADEFRAHLSGHGMYSGSSAFVRNVPALHECYGPDLRCGSLGSGELRLMVAAREAFPGAEWSVGKRVFKVAYCPFCGLKAT